MINIQVDELSDKPDSTVCQREVGSAGVMTAEIFEMSSVRVRRVVGRTDDSSLSFGRLPSFAVAVKRTVAVKRIVLDLFSAEDAHVVRFCDQKQLRVGVVNVSARGGASSSPRAAGRAMSMVMAAR